MAKMAVFLKFFFSQKTRVLITFLLTFWIFFILIRFIGSKELIGVFKRVDAKYAYFGFFLSLLFPFFGTLRWHFVLKATGQNVPLKSCFFAIIGSWPLNIILPSRAGDFLRVVFVGKDFIKTKVFGSIFAEKILDIGSLLIIGLFSAVVTENIGLALLFSLFLLLLVTANQLLYLLGNIFKDRKNKLFRKLEMVVESTTILSLSPRSCFIAGFWSFINWSLCMVQVFTFFKAFAVNVPFIQVCMRFPLSIFGGILPITIAGIGTRDAAMLFFFKKFAKMPAILGVSIFYTLSTYLLYAILGVPFFIYLVNQYEIENKKDIYP